MSIATEQQKDALLLKAENNLANVDNNLINMQSRFELAKKNMLRANGTIRQSYAEEATRRQMEISVLEKHLEELKAYLADVISDLPRREEHRKAAAHLISKAEEQEKAAAELAEKLRKIEFTAQDLRSTAEDQLELSRVTAREIQSQIAQDKAQREKFFLDERNRKEANLRTAQLEYENYEKDMKDNPGELQLEELKRRKEYLEQCQIEAAN